MLNMYDSVQLSQKTLSQVNNSNLVKEEPDWKKELNMAEQMNVLVSASINPDDINIEFDNAKLKQETSKIVLYQGK